jgi:hypothetical protein
MTREQGGGGGPVGYLLYLLMFVSPFIAMSIALAALHAQPSKPSVAPKAGSSAKPAVRRGLPGPGTGVTKIATQNRRTSPERATP